MVDVVMHWLIALNIKLEKLTKNKKYAFATSCPHEQLISQLFQYVEFDNVVKVVKISYSAYCYCICIAHMKYQLKTAYVCSVPIYQKLYEQQKREKYVLMHGDVDCSHVKARHSFKNIPYWKLSVDL